jgi:hypothetical protein
MNGQVTYGYDPVGNRTQKVSTLLGYPGGLINYNANDQLTTDTYDGGGDPSTANKSPGRQKYEAISLDRGLTQDKNFEVPRPHGDDMNVLPHRSVLSKDRRDVPQFLIDCK